MNVLHLDEQMGWRGGEQQASYLIAGAARAGHRQFVAGRAGSEFLLRDHGAPVAGAFALPFRGEADVYTGYMLARIVREHGIDILHAHTSHAHTLALMTRFLAGRCRVVVSRRVDFRPKSNAINRWKYGAPDRIIAISAAIGQIMRDFGVDEAKLRIVHSGIDPSRMDVAPLDRSAMDCPESGPVFGNVAALVGHKDHDTLLRAFAQVIQVLPKAHLVIAGEGPLREAVEGQITALGIASQVSLLGYRDDVPNILKAIDVFVMSSCEEGLGTTVLDAMAAGTPVVATAAGGIPEMVVHEQTGLLVPVGDDYALAQAMIRMHRDKGLGEDVARAASTQLHKRFTAEAMVAGNLKVYEEAIAG